MRRLLAGVLVLMVGFAPARADWPTTSFLPVPPGAETPDDLIDSEFDPYVDDADETDEMGGLLGLSVTGLDVAALKRGAIGALTDIMRLVAIDASVMVGASFPAPKIEPLLRVEESGEAFYPVFWLADYSFAGSFKHECREHVVTFANQPIEMTRSYRWRIFANGDPSTPQTAFPYSRLNSAWQAGGARRGQMFDYMSSQLTHEVMHGVQASGYGNDKCGFGPGWLSEGLADGVAYHLLERRSSGVFDRETWTRNERRYDIPLDGRGAAASMAQSINYGAGSFYRYLIEATESGGAGGLGIVKDIVNMPPATVRATDRIYAELDRIVGAHSSARDLFRVLPEFLTEYASYGEGRYQKAGGGGPLDREDWIADAFSQCVKFTILPGQALTKEVTVQPMAGECIRVEWSGFTQPVALQLYAKGAGSDFGALHVGEAMRSDANGKRFCYDVTKGLTRRIALPMRMKCILKRETRAVGGGGSGVGEEAAWTSDFNLSGSGDVHFVLTNIAKDLKDTKPLTFKLLVGSLEAVKTGGAHVTPRAPGGETEPVTAGMSDPQKRVHTMNGAGDRMFFDGRSILGDSEGLGYLEGVAGATGPGGGPGVMTLVRGGDYWVGFIGARPGQSELGNGGLIIGDPARLESGNPMAGIVISGGMEGMPSGGECGYKMPAEISVLEETPERVRFHVEGDLFDPMRAMTMGAAGGGSTCDLMRAIWVEFAAFDVSLPNGGLHAGDSSVERRTPPGQEVYDESDFLNGPNFGGIATSQSLAAGGAPPADGQGDASGPESGTAGSSGSGGGSSVVTGACDCRCPDAAMVPEPHCQAQCAPQWAICMATGHRAGQPNTQEQADPPPKPPTPTVEAQRKWFSRLIGDQGLSPEIEQMLVDDFTGMSDETRAYLIREYRDGVR